MGTRKSRGCKPCGYDANCDCMPFDNGCSHEHRGGIHGEFFSAHDDGGDCDGY